MTRGLSNSEYNMTFVVENMAETMKAIEDAGAEDLFSFPLDWSKLIGQNKVKPNVPPVHMVNTMDILGFHLELSEWPSTEELGFLHIDYKQSQFWI